MMERSKAAKTVDQTAWTSVGARGECSAASSAATKGHEQAAETAATTGYASGRSSVDKWDLSPADSWDHETDGWLVD